MSEKRRWPWGAIPGLILILAGLIGLYGVPRLSQYAFLPGTGDYAEQMTRAEKKWGDAFAAVSLHGAAEKVSLTAGTKNREGITLYEVMGGYFENYPRAFAAGRPLARGDGKNRVMVLDQDLAFLLFGDADPIGQNVTLGEKRFEVVGVAAHRQRIGETGTYAAWIPLEAEGAPAPRIMTLTAAGGAGGSLRSVFENDAREIFGEGQAIYTEKEQTRGTVMLRLVAIVLMIRVLAFWIRWLTRWIGGRIAGLRQELQRRYPLQMAGRLALEILGMLALTAATVLAAAGIVVWGSGMMMVFPEWVPEVLTDPESVARRFWDLTTAAANPVQFRTPELAEIRFWSGMIRWGLVTALLGWGLGSLSARRSRRNPVSSEK